MEWVQLLAGGLLLYFGAEWFVGGASALALSLRVPQLFIGLTVVAYGTSAPEVIVGIQAARAGHGSVALGNVVGSNIANIGLILGIAALIRPAKVDAILRRRELPVLIASAAVVPLVLLDGVVGHWESAALLIAALAYTAWMVHAARSAAVLANARAHAATAAAAADAAGAPGGRGILRAVVIAAVGLVTLLVGGRLFVDAAVAVAHAMGMSDRLVGLTIVAIGTSLPELITSIIAARRGHSDLAIGNVLGSNIFNILLCLGAAALAGTIGVPVQTVTFDLLALLAMTAFATIVIRTARTITRTEGGIAVGLYAVYVALTSARG